jgi:hypothetical protein
LIHYANYNTRNGGLSVTMLGVPKDVPPSQGDKVKDHVDSTNTMNGVNKILTRAPIMNGVESLADNTSLAGAIGLGAYESESQTKKTYITDNRNAKTGWYDNSAWSGKSMMNQAVNSSKEAYKNATTYNKDNFADKKPWELDFKYELFNSGGRPTNEFFGQRSFTDGSGNIVVSVGKNGIEAGFDINREWVSEYMNTEGVLAGMPVKINASTAGELKVDGKIGAKITKNGLKFDAYGQAGGEALALKLPTVITFGQYPIGDYVFSPQLALTFNAGGLSAYAGAGYQSYKTKLGGDWILGLGFTPVIAGATAKATVGVQPKQK